MIQGTDKNGRFAKGMEPWNKGIKNPAICGDKHPMWKGGKNSPEYKCSSCDGYKSAKSCKMCKGCKDSKLRGVNSYQYKGGKPKCLDCKGETTQYNSTRCRSCYMKSMIGESSPNWKGGITPVSFRVRSSTKMKNWIFKVMSRDNFQCKICKVNDSSLEVHHIIAFSKIVDDTKIKYGIKNLFQNLMESKQMWDTDNGRTLCTKCHSVVDELRNRFTRLNLTK